MDTGLCFGLGCFRVRGYLRFPLPSAWAFVRDRDRCCWKPQGSQLERNLVIWLAVVLVLGASREEKVYEEGSANRVNEVIPSDPVPVLGLLHSLTLTCNVVGVLVDL